MTVENHSKKASDSIVLTGSKEDLKVLLIKRKHDPYKGLWAFPGGFIENGEGADQASKRELLEETGLDLKSSMGVPLSVRKKEGRDPRGKIESFPFLFYGPDLEKVKIVGSDDAAEAKWVPLRKVDDKNKFLEGIMTSFGFNKIVLVSASMSGSYSIPLVLTSPEITTVHAPIFQIPKADDGKF